MSTPSTEPPEVDPRRERLLVVEESVADAARALARARRLDGPYRAEVLALEALARQLSRRLLEDASR